MRTPSSLERDARESKCGPLFFIHRPNSVQFTPVSETTSILTPFIWEPPSLPSLPFFHKRRMTLYIIIFPQNLAQGAEKSDLMQIPVKFTGKLRRKSSLLILNTRE